MAKFEVDLGGEKETIEASTMIVDGVGTLLLWHANEIVATFAAGAWMDCRKVGPLPSIGVVRTETLL